MYGFSVFVWASSLSLQSWMCLQVLCNILQNILGVTEVKVASLWWIPSGCCSLWSNQDCMEAMNGDNDGGDSQPIHHTGKLPYRKSWTVSVKWAVTLLCWNHACCVIPLVINSCVYQFQSIAMYLVPLTGPSEIYDPLKWFMVTPAHNIMCGGLLSACNIKCRFSFVQETAFYLQALL
jgi:hypothetical protein